MDHYFDNFKRQLSLLLDKNRTLKYKYAIFKAIEPGDVVIDFGCGTGILGFFAIQAGAKQVYAIEETTIIEYAEKLALKNEYADQITFLKKPGKEITTQDIPARVDVIVSDPISNLLLEGNAWSTLEFLKQFLNEDGIILPKAGKLLLAPVNEPPENFLDSYYFLGRENVYNVNFLGLPQNVLYKSDLGEQTKLAKPNPLLEYNLLQDRLSDTFQSSIKFSITQPGQFYGVELFVVINLFADIILSSKQQLNYPSWSPIFAPSSYNPYTCPGDTLRVTVSNTMISTYKCAWRFEFIHHSKLLPFDDLWWRNESAIPKLAPGVILSKKGLLQLRKDDYLQYDCDNELELNFIDLFSKGLNCCEICQTIMNSKKFSLDYAEIFDNLIKLIHKLLINSLIELPIPYERFQETKFQSVINIP